MRSRRDFLAGAAALALVPPLARGQATRTVTDDTGRRAEVPAKIARVYAAGPPASMLVFALAPEKLLGWTSPFRPEERPFIPAKYADLPTLGRLTGRGNTANVEVVLAAKPDLIVDYGSVGPTFVSLADRVQAQTGMPYLLLDGAFERIPESLRRLGEILGEPARGEEWARYAQGILDDVAARVARIPRERRPRVYYGRGPRGLDTGLAGSIDIESIERMGATNVAAALGKGGLVQVSVEQVLAWDPDAIVTIDRTFYASLVARPAVAGAEGDAGGESVPLAERPRTAGLSFPPSINRLVGLRWLGRELVPRRHSPRICRPLVRELHYAGPTTRRRPGAARRARPDGRAAPGLTVGRTGLAVAGALALLAVGRPRRIRGRALPGEPGRARDPRSIEAHRDRARRCRRRSRRWCSASAVRVSWPRCSSAPRSRLRGRRTRACSAIRWCRPTSSACRRARRSERCSASSCRSTSGRSRGSPSCSASRPSARRTP